MQLRFQLFSPTACLPVLAHHAFIGPFCFSHFFRLLVIYPLKYFLLFCHGFHAVRIVLILCIHFLQFRA